MSFEDIIKLSSLANEAQQRFNDEAIEFAKKSPHVFLGLEKMYNELGTEISRVYSKYKSIAEESLAEIDASYDNFQSMDFINRDELVFGLVKRCPYPLRHVLELRISQIDTKNSLIKYFKHYVSEIKEVRVYYPAHFIRCLNEYIERSSKYRKHSDFVFVTRTGAPVTRGRISYSLKESSMVLHEIRDSNNGRQGN